MNGTDRSCGKRGALTLDQGPVIYGGGELLLLEGTYLICLVFEKFWLSDALTNTGSLETSIDFAFDI